MAIGKKKMLFCETCVDDKWAVLQYRYTFKCNDCGGEIDLIKAKKKKRAERKAGRILKQKQNGTYLSASEKKRNKAEARGQIINIEYIEWVKRRPCCVPGCNFKGIVDAHHAVHKSQGRDDRTCVPLCHEHHIGEYHGKLGSVEAAERNWDINLIKVAAQHWKMWTTLKETERARSVRDDKQVVNAPDPKRFSYANFVKGQATSAEEPEFDEPLVSRPSFRSNRQGR